MQSVKFNLHEIPVQYNKVLASGKEDIADTVIEVFVLKVCIEIICAYETEGAPVGYELGWLDG